MTEGTELKVPTLEHALVIARRMTDGLDQFSSGPGPLVVWAAGQGDYVPGCASDALAGLAEGADDEALLLFNYLATICPDRAADQAAYNAYLDHEDVMDSLPALTSATRVAYRALENGADPNPVYDDLRATYAEHGLDANVAESSVDWLEGGPGLLTESLTDAIARKKES